MREFSKIPESELNHSPKVELKELGHHGNEYGENYEFDIHNEIGDKIGIVDVSLDHQNHEINIGEVEIISDSQRKGYGKETYKKVIAFAKERGYRFRSTGLISEQATRVWQSLEREGLAEEIDGAYYAK